jgi:hypothetical protein
MKKGRSIAGSAGSRGFQGGGEGGGRVPTAAGTNPDTFLDLEICPADSRPFCDRRGPSLDTFLGQEVCPPVRPPVFSPCVIGRRPDRRLIGRGPGHTVLPVGEELLGQFGEEVGDHNLSPLVIRAVARFGSKYSGSICPAQSSTSLYSSWLGYASTSSKYS